jgi:hypothetical protein
MLNYYICTRSAHLVDILRWMFELGRAVTVSKLWWEMDQDLSFKHKDKKFKYEEEIWSIVEFLESEVLLNSHLPSIQNFLMNFWQFYYSTVTLVLEIANVSICE